MSENSGNSSGWVGWIAAVVIGAVFLWHFNRKADPQPVSPQKEPLRTVTLKPAPPATPQVEYERLSPPELLVEARAAGLDPEVNKASKLVLKHRPDAVALARALYRREDEIISLLDPDAPLRRQLVGTWEEVSREDPPAKTFPASGVVMMESQFKPRPGNSGAKKVTDKATITYRADGTFKETVDNIVATLAVGTVNGRWSLTGSTVYNEFKSASGPAAPFGEWAVAGSVERWKILSLTAKRLRVDWKGVYIREFARK